MKKLLLLLPALILAGMFFYGCQDTNVVDPTNNPGRLNAIVAPTFILGNPVMSDFCDYISTGNINRNKDEFGSYYWDAEFPDGIAVSLSADGKYLNWTAPEGICVMAVIVKGGPNANIYYYNGNVSSDGNLVSPDHPRAGQIPAVSHVSFCYRYCDGDCQTETAFGGNTGINVGQPGAWWYYYNASSGGVQTIWAGQTIDVGTVTVVAGVVNITLTGGWQLEDVDDPVKIKGYNVLPTKRPAAGQFTGEGTYKGSDLTDINIGIYSYYVIHLDVELCD